MIPEYFAYFTVVISLSACAFYIRDIISGKAKPNRVTWIFWGIAPIVGTYIAYKSGVSLPLLASTFMAGFVSIPILIASFFNKESYWKTTLFDVGCGVLSAIAIIIWVTTKNGIVSLTFAILADLFAGLPTIIKSWQHSDTENIAPYSFGTLNSIITFLIIKNPSFLNIAFPLYLVITNTTIMLGIKRKFFAKLLRIS